MKKSIFGKTGLTRLLKGTGSSHKTTNSYTSGNGRTQTLSRRWATHPVTGKKECFWFSADDAPYIGRISRMHVNPFFA